MNLIEQLQSDVARHQRQLEEELERLKAAQAETRQVLRSVVKYAAKLGKQHPNGEAALPLGDPDEPPEVAEIDDRFVCPDGELDKIVPEEFDDEPEDSSVESVAAYQARRSASWEDSKDAADAAEAGAMTAEVQAKARRHKAKSIAEE